MHGIEKYEQVSARTARSEQGVIILLVAVFMLFVVGAMAALAIDVVTLYTARSEAQLAADGAALAGARVLANSGMTSDSTAASADRGGLATTVATQVATSNEVGGRNLKSSDGEGRHLQRTSTSFVTNPHVTVQVQRTDLPTFFARIWGSTDAHGGCVGHRRSLQSIGNGHALEWREDPRSRPFA